MRLIHAYRRGVLAVVAILALVLAGCGGPGTEDAATSPSDTPATEAPASTVTPRPDDPLFPDEFPLPDGGTYLADWMITRGTFGYLEGDNWGPIHVFSWPMSVEELISTMDRVLAEAGWTTSEHVSHIAFARDVGYRAVGHGREVGIEISPFDEDDDAAAYIAVLLIDD